MIYGCLRYSIVCVGVVVVDCLFVFYCRSRERKSDATIEDDDYDSKDPISLEGTEKNADHDLARLAGTNNIILAL